MGRYWVEKIKGQGNTAEQCLSACAESPRVAIASSRVIGIHQMADSILLMLQMGMDTAESDCTSSYRAPACYASTARYYF